MTTTDNSPAPSSRFAALWAENAAHFGEFNVCVEREGAPVAAPTADETPAEESHGVNVAALLDGDTAATQTPFHRGNTAEVEAVIDAALARRNGCAVCYRLVNAATGEAVDARIIDAKFGRVWKIAKRGGLCEFVDAGRTSLEGKTVKGYRAERVSIACAYRYAPSLRIPSLRDTWLTVEVYPVDPTQGQRW